MNQLFFEGKVTNLYAEDYQYLQDSIKDKVQAVVKYLVANKNSTSIVQGFLLKVNITNNKTFDIVHTNAWDEIGAILSGDSLFFETSQTFSAIPLDNYTLNTSTGVYVFLDYVYGSYDRKNGILVEGEKKAVDLYDNTLVYNRKTEKIRVVQLALNDYNNLSAAEKRKHIYLGSFLAQGAGAAIVGPNLEGVSYLTSNIIDHSIPLIKLANDFILPQRMVSATSTGDINEDTYTTAPVDIHDDLNNIRTIIKRIKTSEHWDTPQEGVAGSLPQQNDLWKVGVFDHAFTDAPDSYFSLTLPGTINDMSAVELFYSFDNQTNLGEDSSTHSRDGICSNVISSPLIYGNAASFNGVSSQIETPIITRSDVVGQYFTINAAYTGQSSTINPTIFYSGAGVIKDVILWKRSEGSSYVEFLSQLDANNYVKVSIDAFNIFKYAGYAATVSVLVETDYVNSTKAVYINNVLQVGATTIVTVEGSISGLIGQGHPYYIGNDGSPTNYFSGVLDQFHIFNRALTESERDRIYGLPGNAIIGKGSALLGSAIRTITDPVFLPLPGIPQEAVGDIVITGSGEFVDIALLPSLGVDLHKEFILSKCTSPLINVIAGSCVIRDAADPSVIYQAGIDYSLSTVSGQVNVYIGRPMYVAQVECLYSFTGPRTDLISISIPGVSYVPGEISAKPVPPELPYQTLPLYFINRRAGKTYISPNEIIDVRLKRTSLRESTEITVNDVGCYSSLNEFQSYNYWSFHKYTIIDSGTGVLVPLNTGWARVPVDSGEALQLQTNYTYQAIAHFQDNDELWLDVLLQTTPYNITFAIETLYNSNNFSQVYTITTPSASIASTTPTPLLLHKGFNRGYYRIRIIGSATFTLNRLLIGKYDFYYTHEHTYIKRLTVDELSVAGLTISGIIVQNLEIPGVLTIGSDAFVANLNADRLDNYHAGNLANQVPVSNGVLNANLNADMLDGHHIASVTAIKTAIFDFNTMLAPGIYDIHDTGSWVAYSNYPVGAVFLGTLTVDTGAIGHTRQVYSSAATYELWERRRNNIGVWTSWRKILNSDGKSTNADLLDGLHSHDIIPIGSIIAWSPGFFANGANGAYTEVAIPLPSGWQLCDGAALDDPGSPIFNGIGKYLPMLTDSRFLMGSLTSGLIGGANDISLMESNLPSHVHTISHTHTFSGTSGTVSSGHTHGIYFNSDWVSADHSHKMDHTHITYGNADDHSVAPASFHCFGRNTGYTAGTSGASRTQTGGISANHYHLISGTTADINQNHTHWYSGTTSDVSNGNSGAVGSGAAFSILPKYLTTKYIMRTK